MVIDFHTHIFPPTLAPRALASLKAGIKRQTGTDAATHTDATYDGLLRSMDENGVDMSIVLPIVTNPRKSKSIIEYAKTVRGERILSLASVHPMQENASDAVKRIKEDGFVGIKLHPEFQQCYIDSPETIAVLRAAESAGLVVVIHTGADIGLPPPVHCTPRRLKNALEYVNGDSLVAAHMGGWCEWDDVEKYLIETPIYMDTAFVADYIDREQCARIIRAHGADRILFGSDSPWENPAHTFEFIRSLGLNDTELDMITYKNAQTLLKRFT